MRVLCTGAAGLLGRAVVPLLRENGHDTVSADRRFNSVENFEEVIDLATASVREIQMLFTARDIEAVVHLAGRRASVAKQHALAADLLLDNLAIDVNVFRAMRAHGVKRGVYASTVSVYPEEICDQWGHGDCPPESGYLEEHAYAFPAESVRFSAWGKLTAERTVEALNLQDSSSISVVRLVNTYGPYDDFGPDALVIPSLIRRYLGETEPQLVSSDHERDFLYVEDAARGIVSALESEKAGTWNLGTGAGVRIADVARHVAQACFPQAPTRWVHVGHAGSTGGASRKVVDPSKAKRELGWEPRVSLADGIQRTVAFFRHAIVGTS